MRTAQSLPVIPMGPPPSSGGSSVPSFGSPSQYAGPPGPPVFSSPPQPSQPEFNAQLPKGPSNFAEIPLASLSSPPVDNRFSGSSGAGHQHGLAEEEFDAYSLSASAPFLLFSAQKVLFFLARIGRAYELRLTLFCDICVIDILVEILLRGLLL